MVVQVYVNWEKKVNSTNLTKFYESLEKAKKKQKV